MARVSVLLAVRNGLPYLDESIGSIVSQTFPDFELIVVDDGSTDGTPDLLARWRREDPRVVVIRQQHQGQTPGLNRAIAAATGQYLARQDADDVSEPERFAREVEHLDRHPRLAVVGTGAAVIDASGEEIGSLPAPPGPAVVRRRLWGENVLNHGSVMMRREALDKVGAYRAGFRFANDWDLWLRMVQQGFELDNLPDVLYRWRLNPNGAYARERAQQIKFAGLALILAMERERFREDSYDQLLAAHEDLDRFAASYRLRGPLYALWGELCLRALAHRAAATRYLLRALASGYVRPRLLALLCLSLSGVGWPGRPALRSS
jgi:glycosyltransferase involved in cell wall biosynthesis